MKGTKSCYGKCPYCESPIPILHGLLKRKKLSKEHEDRTWEDRMFRGLRYKPNCLRSEQDFEIKTSKIAVLLFLVIHTLINSFTTYISNLLGIELSGIWFLVLIFQFLTSLFFFTLMLILLNSIFITTWPVRDKSE